jgi:putative transcriptional regulator
MNKSRILKGVHDTAKGLHSIGVISAVTMKDYDKLCLSPIHELGFKEIKELRQKENVSQAIFAALLNTSVSTVQKWEIGKKKPSGIALKLLNIIEKKGLDGTI